MIPRNAISSAPAIRWLSSIALLLACFLGASRADAYPWMIRHGYSGCTPCHADPSGAGALTEYGRAQGDLLLMTHYGRSSEEASPTSGFLWGELRPPEELRLGGDWREGYLVAKPDVGPSIHQLITMRADLFADLKIGRFRAEGSLGYAPTGARAAALSGRATDNIVSRDHWIGAELDDDGAWLLRGGRITLPFGIRSVEHTLWVRHSTRTDLNDTQQYGAALSFAAGILRGEVMGIAGNLQVHPDAFRERGYSAYIEASPAPRLALGVSSLFTRATRDVNYRVTDYRQAHGAFVRYAPISPLVILAEGDFVYQSLTWNGHRGGFAAFVQADWEPRQGIHFMATGETMNGGSAGEPPSYGGWASAVWFFAPHADVRLDDVIQRLGNPAGDTTVYSMLFQFHVYL